MGSDRTVTIITYLWLYKFFDDLYYVAFFEKLERPSFSDGLRRVENDLQYSEEDVESSSRFVLLCPCKILEDGTVIKYTEFYNPRTHPCFELFFPNPMLNSSRSHGVYRIHNCRGIQHSSRE